MSKLSKLPRVSKQGFSLEGSKAQILLLHGFTGTPYDLKPLGLALHDEGWQVSAPLLSGHGKKPEHLFNVKAADWIKNAQDGMSKLDKQRPKIVVGLSMGALLATILAHQHGDQISALVLLSPSFKLKISGEITTTLTRLKILPPRGLIKKLSGGSDIADAAAKKKCPSLKEIPLSGLLEFDSIRQSACKKITEISCPLFIGFGCNDEAINVEGSKRIALEAASPLIVVKEYTHSKHILPLDFDRELLKDDVIHFINQCLGV